MQYYFLLVFLLLVPHLLLAQTPEQDQKQLDEALDHLKKKAYKPAEIKLRDYLSRHPNNPYALNGMGIVRYRQGKLEQAIRWYSKAIRADPDFLGVYENRASAKADLGNIAGALTDVNYVLYKDSMMVSAYINRAHIWLTNKDTLLAFQDFDQSIQLGASTPDAYTGRGMCYWYQRNLKMAMQDLRYAMRRFPDDPHVYANYGIIQMEGFKDFEKAYQFFSKAYDLGCYNTTVTYGLGASCQVLRKFDQSILHFTAYIKMYPTNASAYCNRGTALAEQKKYELALKDFEKSLVLDSLAIEVLINRALFVYMPLGKIELALADMKRAIKMKEASGINPAFSYNNLGYFQLKNGNPKEGLKNVNYSLELNPRNSYAYKNLALIYLELDDQEAAWQAANKAIELGFERLYGAEILDIQAKACHAKNR